MEGERVSVSRFKTEAKVVIIPCNTVTIANILRARWAHFLFFYYTEDMVHVYLNIHSTSNLYQSQLHLIQETQF